MSAESTAPPAPPRGHFSASDRDILAEDILHLISVGVDIGSSTSHLVFSRLHLARQGARYVVTGREVLSRSPVTLTPYTDHSTIDGVALGEFIDQAYRFAELTREEIDTGALILTGAALRRENARAIADLFARDAGRFVSVSAGDELEALLAARGSGAVALAARLEAPVLHVDIGGGTSKFALCASGSVASVAAIDVGARLVAVDSDNRLVRLEETGRDHLRRAGLPPLEMGDVLGLEDQRRLAATMAQRLMRIIVGAPQDDDDRALLRTEPLERPEQIAAVTFSGGVAEFIYGREQASFGDLGALLADELRALLDQSGLRVEVLAAGIRATVIGASQYTVQLSGSTILVDPPSTLPLRNLPVLAPNLPLAENGWDASTIDQEIRRELQRLHLETHEGPVAIAVRWRGSASYARIDRFCRGVMAGMEPVLHEGTPLVLLFDSDVGGVFGLHLREEMAVSQPVIAADSIQVEAFDYVDVGELIHSSGAVPVVIKSLVFGSAATPAAR